MRYDAMGNPVQKDSVSYEYNTVGHPNAVSGAGDKTFRYDANGNPISVEDTTANTLRVMQWDEEDRLQSLGDDGYVSRYTYDHAGGRVVKSHGSTTVAFVNGAPQGVLWHDKDNWTMYVGPYMVVSADRFTKHYYAGGQRIASKIGVGEFNNLYDASKACVTAGQKDYAGRMSLIARSRNDYYAALGIPPGPPTAKGIYGEAEYTGSYGDYAQTPLGNYDVPENRPRKPYKRPYGGTPGPPVMYEKPSDPEDEHAGYGYSNGMGRQERNVFFYHSDHLGGTSYVTAKDGNATQFVSYKPYGEVLVDEHAASFESPWKFNGKELDAETGLYYYGARYYEPVLAVWYGVDRLTERTHFVSPYSFCFGNPIKYKDPDGNIPIETIWDVANVALGVSSLVENIANGDFSDALVDAGGVIVDAAAVALPYVPGGVSTAIKANRASRGVNQVKTMVPKPSNAVPQTRRAAFRQAKRDAGIPTSQTHFTHKNVDAAKNGSSGRKGIDYEFETTGSYGKTEIRHVQDYYEGHVYMDRTVDNQPHFNIHQEKTGLKIKNEDKHYP